MHKRETDRELARGTEDPDGRSSGESASEGETVEIVPRPPLAIRQLRQQAVAIPLPAWRRLQGRIEAMPEASTIWLALAGALAGVSLERHDETSLLTGAGSLLCYLAHRAVAKANRSARADIVEEMQLHDPSPRHRSPKQ